VYYFFIHDPHIHWRLKIVHVSIRSLQYMGGMSLDKPFNRDIFKNVPKSSADITTHNVIALDSEIPSHFGPHSIPIRIFRSKSLQTSQNAPILVYFHGGGFVFGDLADFSVDELARRFASSLPIVVVSVNYRLAPEHPFPAAPQDSYSVLRWLSQEENIQQFSSLIGQRVDNQRIAVGGDSAGGNLAVVITIMAREENLTNVIHMTVVYPGFFITTIEGSNHYIYTGEMKKFMTHSYLQGQSSDNPYINPVRFSEKLALLPPAHVITAEYDPIKYDGIAFVEEMRKLGKKVAHNHYPSIHSFFSVSGTPEYEDALKRVIEDIRDAITLE